MTQFKYTYTNMVRISTILVKKYIKVEEPMIR